ncbi:MAG: hypothetical protein ACREMP_05440 [Candidatus Tyrphobacter sp.]
MAGLFGAALALVPLYAYPETSLRAPLDLRAALMMRLFGEVSAPRPGFVQFTPETESPLGQAALVVRLLPSHAGSVLVARRAQGVSVPASASYVLSTPPSVTPQIAGRAAELPPSVRLPVSSAYTSAPPTVFTADAQTGAFSFRGVSVMPASSAAFAGAQSGGFAQSVRLPVALRVGNLRVLAGFDAGFSSTLENGIDNTLPVFVPAFAGVSRSSLGANLAVPVAPRLLVGLGYNTERLVTGYGVPSILNGLDARNDTYTGNLTFLFPHFGSALSLSAQQFRYQDNVIPGEFTQLRENVDLTVKF